MEALRPVTTEEYLARDAATDERLEFWHGEIVAMAGETYNHSLVKDDLFSALRQRATCAVHSSGLRARAPGLGRSNYAYPDVIMVCEKPRFDDRHQPPTLLNPALLVEVASDSTRGRDMADKLDAYFRLDSLIEYWVVEPDVPKIIRYTRNADGFRVQLVVGADAELVSDTLGVTIPLREVYARVLDEA